MKHKKAKGHLFFLFFFFLYLAGQNIYSNISSGSSSSKDDKAASFANRPLTSTSFIFDGRILIPLKINDFDEMDIILDSGFASNALLLLHKETGDELGLDPARVYPSSEEMARHDPIRRQLLGDSSDNNHRFTPLPEDTPLKTWLEESGLLQDAQ